MPLIVKQGDLTQGHGNASPIPAQAGIALGSVFIQNLSVVVTTDTIGLHGTPNPHPAVAGPGSSTVFAKNLPVWRKGDLALCGDIANVMLGNVYADGN